MCFGGPKSPDTSAQQAEALRQQQIEQARQQELLAAQQAEWERQRQDGETRYQQQLAGQQAQVQAQLQQQQAIEAQREAERQAAMEAAQRSADAAKSYQSGRTTAIQGAQSLVDEAFGGFNDNFFNGYSKKLIDADTPSIEQNAATQARNLRFKFANNGNLNSSAAADALAQVQRDKDSKLAQVAQNAATQASAYRANVQGMAADAKNQLYSLGNAQVPSFANSDDANTALGSLQQQLAAITQQVRQKASAAQSVF